jgi:hypothetical protein
MLAGLFFFLCIYKYSFKVVLLLISLSLMFSSFSPLLLRFSIQTFVFNFYILYLFAKTRAQFFFVDNAIRQLLKKNKKKVYQNVSACQRNHTNILVN